MGIADVDTKLASNRLIFDIRRDRDLMAAFRKDLEEVMAKYKLTEAERAAWRAIDIAALGRLGVHPYFLPQVSRMFEGSGYNHNDSEAARLYAKTMLDGDE